MTIYDDIAVARQVVEDLVSAGFPRSSISLTTNDANNQYSHYLDKDYIPSSDAVSAARGASFGAVVGIAIAILAEITALTLPIGAFIGAGSLAAGIIGALVGAVIGGLVGALIKTEVEQDHSPYYAEGIRRGGTLVRIETSDTIRAQDILNRYGSINIHERSNLWRQAGWKGFHPEEDADLVITTPEMLNTVTTNTTTTRVTHSAYGVTPAEPMPHQQLIVEEPPIDEEDTSKRFPAIILPPAHDTTPLPDTVIIEESDYEPDPVTADEEVPDKEYVYTADDFQMIHLNLDPPKG